MTKRESKKKCIKIKPGQYVLETDICDKALKYCSSKVGAVIKKKKKQVLRNSKV